MSQHTIETYSRGMYSSWCWHQASRILFDCGEGISTHLTNRLYGIETICLSHQHSDHINGLLSILGCREAARGDKTKGIRILYPHDNVWIEHMRDFIHQRHKKLSFEVQWIPLKLGDAPIDLGNNRSLHWFPSKHQFRGEQTFLYKIVEKRQRLKDVYQGQDIRAMLATGIIKANLMESYDHVTFSYLLDTFGFDVTQIEGCDMAVIDSNFVHEDERDKDWPAHLSMKEALDICCAAGVKHTVLSHLSSRYTIEEAQKQLDLLRGDLKVTLVNPNQVNYI